MSDFDISIGAEPEEKEIKVSCKLLSDSQYARLQSYVDAVNSIRLSKGAKSVDYKYLLPALIMRGIDTEQTELPEHLLKKVKATRKRRNSDNQGSDDESQSMAQAAE